MNKEDVGQFIKNLREEKGLSGNGVGIGDCFLGLRVLYVYRA